MYLSKLKLWNFRKYGAIGAINLNNPNLVVSFAKRVNVLVGENDSGKTAILDAIKLVLKTYSIDWIHLEETDFYQGTDELRIELEINELSIDEASHFTEWLSWNEELNTPFLRLIYRAQRLNDRILSEDVTAGAVENGKPIDCAVKELIKCTYLKALRDASGELTAKRNSRISQILRGHNLFHKTLEKPHPLESIICDANRKIEEWLSNTELQQTDGKPIPNSSNFDLLKGKLDAALNEFVNEEIKSKFTVSDPELKGILDSLSVSVDNSINMGLGTQNRLYMAAELLHLDNANQILSLCLIEELEAHLHPQAQMKVMQALQQKKVQLIMTTHSPNLTSKLKLSDENTNVMMCYKNDVYPMNSKVTKLDLDDCRYLDHFLDVTKANLFFAKGVILVEGWTEEILIPVIAAKLGLDLTKHEISIVNVGSTAYFRYAKLFIREDKAMNYPISIVTDLDISPEKLKKEEANQLDNNINYAEIDQQTEEIKKNQIISCMNLPLNSTVRMFISPHWTLEWCLFLSDAIKSHFMESVMLVHSKTEEFKKNDEKWNEIRFRNKLIEKLKDRSLDKVAIAQTLADRLTDVQLDFNHNDSAYYLVDAIKYACENNR